jgi:DedD protein
VNLRIDERTKHRLTGLVVIAAVAIIFVPAMIKKSNQRLEENIHLSVQLPPKPSAPKVTVAEKKAVFETVKVAKMEVPVAAEPARVSRLARVDGPHLKPVQKIEQKPDVPRDVPMAESTAPKEQSVVFTKVEPVAVNPVKIATVPTTFKPEIKKSLTAEAYAVQLASFTVQRNAENLVSRLRSQGYKARYHTIKSAAGDNFYKVTVGQLNARADARALKEKLSNTTQLEGFVVKRDVG